MLLFWTQLRIVSPNRLTQLLTCSLDVPHSAITRSRHQQQQSFSQPNSRRTIDSLCTLGTDRIGNTRPNSSIVISLGFRQGPCWKHLSQQFYCCFIAWLSARAAYRTPLPAYSMLTCHEGVAYQRAFLQNRSLATALSVDFAILAFGRHTTMSVNFWIKRAQDSEDVFCSPNSVSCIPSSPTC
jgi:hypothetical protein